MKKLVLYFRDLAKPDRSYIRDTLAQRLICTSTMSKQQIEILCRATYGGSFFVRKTSLGLRWLKNL